MGLITDKHMQEKPGAKDKWRTEDGPRGHGRMTARTPESSAQRTNGDLLTPAQKRFIERLIAETESDLAQLLIYFGFDSLDCIPKSEVNRVIKALESKRRAA